MRRLKRENRDAVREFSQQGLREQADRYGRLHVATRLQPNRLKQLRRRLGRATGIPKVHAHRFRHTFATWAIAHEARELDLRHLLGHTGPKMVRRYTTAYHSEQAAQHHARYSPGDLMLAALDL